ncbi:MAG: 50S ribosomal protein L22 [bacterium]|nr:50S ribosomal protein L22 [bacterium]
MEITAKLNNLRIAPRKVRLVADLVRGKSAYEANELLGFCVKRGSLPLKKLLQSCVQNSKHNFQIENDNLFIKEIKVDEGVKLKRWHPMSRGRAGAIQKKTCHITLILSELSDSTKPVLKPSLKDKKDLSPKEEKKDKKKITKIKKPEFNVSKERKGLSKANLKKVFRRKAI